MLIPSNCNRLVACRGFNNRQLAKAVQRRRLASENFGVSEYLKTYIHRYYVLKVYFAVVTVIPAAS